MVGIPESAGPASAASPMSSAAGSPPGQPPAGPSPNATPATANRGEQASALLQLQGAATIIQRALMAVGAGSDMGKDLLDILKKLSKYLPAQPPSAGLQSSAMRQFMNTQRQGAPNNDLIRALNLKQQAPAQPPNVPNA